MRRTTRLVTLAFVGIASFSLATTPSLAGQAFKKLSNNHLRFGVSQFLAGNINTRNEATPLKLFNPTPVAQIVAALFYQRESDGNNPGGNAGEFQACLVRELPSHGAVQISLAGFLPVPRAYVEIISAPVTPVRGRKRNERDDDDDDDDDNDDGDDDHKHSGHHKKELRLADGLGIRGSATLTNFVSGSLSMVHPKLFSLPSDDVIPDQQKSAIDCVCFALPDGSDLEIFEDFGIDCTN